MTPKDNLGNELRASFSVEPAGAGFEIFWAARGGSLNEDYGPALEVVFGRLRDLSAVFFSAEVASRDATALPPELRQLVCPTFLFPLEMKNVVDLVALRLELGRACAAVGRVAKDGGNGTKRLRLTFRCDALSDNTPDEIEEILGSGFATRPATAQEMTGERVAAKKYAPLGEYLTEQSVEEITLTLPEIADLVGGLPAEASTPQFWANATGHHRSRRGQWLEAGYQAFFLQGQNAVKFRRGVPGPNITEAFSEGAGPDLKSAAASGLPTLEEVVGDVSGLMGVKAVWGYSSAPVMCFGSRGNAALKDKSYFSQARLTAERSVAQPYFITIGGGKSVAPDLDGRVLEVVRSTTVYGEMTVLVQDPELRERLTQWPVAVLLSEVYTFEGSPHLQHDLGFTGKDILTNSYDTVLRHDTKLETLWNALRQWPVERRLDMMLPQGLAEPAKATNCGTFVPTLKAESEEGKRVWREMRVAERDAGLRQIAKDRNRVRYGGIYTCEACGFADVKSSMFDAHHLLPIALRVRVTKVSDLAILCPTCHRWAHTKSKNRLSPLPVVQVGRQRRQEAL